jgi:hypothetical protein
VPFVFARKSFFFFEPYRTSAYFMFFSVLKLSFFYKRGTGDPDFGLWVLRGACLTVGSDISEADSSWLSQLKRVSRVA